MDLLQVENLRIEFRAGANPAVAVGGLSFRLRKGKTLGIVGESGCGKTATALSILRLLPAEPECKISGRILFDGRNLFDLTRTEIEAVRGKAIGMVFQDPMTALNPVIAVGKQIREAILLHQPKISSRRAREMAIELIAKVGIGDSAQGYARYPHQLSGGMRQRCLIAMAIACHPRILIADEPTTALDVTLQAQILEIIRGLQKEIGMAMLWISHDLGVVSEIADEVMVMYAGLSVEQAEVGALFQTPLHPYTQGLIASLPPDPREEKMFSRLQGIPGSVPDPTVVMKGCRFAPRCPIKKPHCETQLPEWEEKRPGHWVRCFEVPALLEGTNPK